MQIIYTAFDFEPFNWAFWKRMRVLLSNKEQA